ncbi:hypothetical protein [Nocardia sp. NPDC055049]
MSAPVEISHVYAVTRAYLAELVEARATSGETDDQFVSLCLDLRGANPDNLAQLLAGAVLRLAAAERERGQHLDEIARLRAELETEQARAEHTKTRLRRRIHRANRGRAALRTPIIRQEAAAS